MRRRVIPYILAFSGCMHVPANSSPSVHTGRQIACTSCRPFSRCTHKDKQALLRLHACACC